jgi:hypothetical protein
MPASKSADTKEYDSDSSLSDLNDGISDLSTCTDDEAIVKKNTGEFSDGELSESSLSEEELCTCLTRVKSSTQ